jgi:hypothetical protein
MIAHVRCKCTGLLHVDGDDPSTHCAWAMQHDAAGLGRSVQLHLLACAEQATEVLEGGAPPTGVRFAHGSCRTEADASEANACAHAAMISKGALRGLYRP